MDFGGGLEWQNLSMPQAQSYPCRMPIINFVIETVPSRVKHYQDVATKSQRLRGLRSWSFRFQRHVSIPFILYLRVCP